MKKKSKSDMVKLQICQVSFIVKTVETKTKPML